MPQPGAIAHLRIALQHRVAWFSRRRRAATHSV
jgi:hypothetical protein